MHKTILLISITLALTGCASQLQAVGAFNTSALTSARATADLAASDAVLALCGMSIDTLSRHPEYVTAVTDLCLKDNQIMASAAIKTNVLPTVQPIQLTPPKP